MKAVSQKHKEPAKIGRPTIYSEELANRICEEIALGAVLQRICDRDDLPDHSTVYRWLEAHEDFRERYRRARDLQADFFADEIITIVDEEKDANRARVRMDGRKWHSSKTAPKKYGDRAVTELVGKDGGAVQLEPVRSPLEIIEERLARLIAARPVENG